MAQAAEGRAGWLAYARGVAEAIARDKGSVTADDVRAAGVETPPNTSPNIWGSVFNDARFAFLDFAYSARPEAHHNLIRRWGIREAMTA